MADVAEVKESPKVATPEKEVPEKVANDGEKTPVKDQQSNSEKEDKGTPQSGTKQNGVAEEPEQNGKGPKTGDSPAVKRKSEVGDAGDSDKAEGATPEKKAKLEENGRISPPKETSQA